MPIDSSQFIPGLPGRIIRHFNFAQKIGHYLIGIPNLVLSALGVVMLLAGLALGTSIQRKEIAVSVVFVSASTGAILLSLFLPKWIYRTMEEALQRRQETNEALRKVEAELARVRNMAIDLGGIEESFTINLLSLPQKVTQFCTEIVDKEEANWYSVEKRHVFYGIIEFSGKVHLGIDVRKLVAHEDANGRLVIGGMSMTAFLESSQEPHWPLEEIRIEKIKEGKILEFGGIPDDPRLLNVTRKQAALVRQDLKSNERFKLFEPALFKVAQTRLRLLLGGMGKEIIFSENGATKGTELVAYLTEYNERVRRDAIILEEKRATYLGSGTK